MMDGVLEMYVKQVRLVRKLTDGLDMADLDPVVRSACRKAASFGKRMTKEEWDIADDLLWMDTHDPYELIYDTAR